VNIEFRLCDVDLKVSRLGEEWTSTIPARWIFVSPHIRGPFDGGVHALYTAGRLIRGI